MAVTLFSTKTLPQIKPKPQKGLAAGDRRNRYSGAVLAMAVATTLNEAKNKARTLAKETALGDAANPADGTLRKTKQKRCPGGGGNPRGTGRRVSQIQVVQHMNDLFVAYYVARWDVVLACGGAATGVVTLNLGNDLNRLERYNAFRPACGNRYVPSGCVLAYALGRDKRGADTAAINQAMTEANRAFHVDVHKVRTDRGAPKCPAGCRRDAEMIEPRDRRGRLVSQPQLKKIFRHRVDQAKAKLVLVPNQPAVEVQPVWLSYYAAFWSIGGLCPVQVGMGRRRREDGIPV